MQNSADIIDAKKKTNKFNKFEKLESNEKEQINKNVKIVEDYRKNSGDDAANQWARLLKIEYMFPDFKEYEEKLDNKLVEMQQKKTKPKRMQTLNELKSQVEFLKNDKKFELLFMPRFLKLILTNCYQKNQKNYKNSQSQYQQHQPNQQHQQQHHHQHP